MVLIQKSNFFSFNSLPFLSSCLFWRNQFRKDCFLIFWIKKNDFDNRKNKVLKSPKQRDFSKGITMVFVQISNFFTFIFFG